MMSKEKYYATFPKNRAGAGVIFFNDKKEILILKPNYRDNWILPGGVIDPNESPRQTVIREIKEELDLELKNPRFICVDYKHSQGIKPDGYFFIFYGGELSKNQIKKIKLQNEELLEYKFSDILQAQNLLIYGIKNRLNTCLEAIEKNTSFYLENGKPI